MNTEYSDRLKSLADRWCERRALKPLSCFLPSYLALNGLTDGYAALAEGIRDTLVFAKEEITENEMTELRSLLANTESAIYRK